MKELIKLSFKNLEGSLAGGAIGTFGLKIISYVLSFIVSVLLARLLGASDYGAFNYALTWVNWLGVIAVLGLNQLFIRAVASYQVRSAWNLLRGLLSWGTRMVLIVSLALTFVAAVIASYLAYRSNSDSQILITFYLSLILLPLMSLTILKQSTLEGLNYVARGHLIQTFILPMFFLLFTISAYLLLGQEFNSTWAMGARITAVTATYLIATWMLRQVVPLDVKQASPIFETRVWISSALPLVLVNGMRTVNARADTIIVGTVLGVKAVGLYHVATRASQFVTFVLLAVNAALGPAISRLYTKGDNYRLQHIITKAARASFAGSLIITAGFVIFGRWFLKLYGPDFVQSYNVLVILSIGELANAALGSVGLLLIMTDYERDVGYGVGLSAFINVFLTIILVPNWGIEGAAIASATSRIAWNLLLALLVNKRLKIHPTVLGKVKLWSVR